MIDGECQSGLDCSVLVLNKHYMAIRIVGARRAFSLLCRDLAEVVSFEKDTYANYDFKSWCEVSRFRHEFEPDAYDWVSTVNFYVAVPRIIRLLFYDRLPRTDVKFNRRNIFARDRNHCQYCGKRFPTTELSLDHVIPRTHGRQGDLGQHRLCLHELQRQEGRPDPQAGRHDPHPEARQAQAQPHAPHPSRPPALPLLEAIPRPRLLVRGIEVTA